MDIDTPQIALPFNIGLNGQITQVEQDTLDEIAMSVEAILRYPVGYRADLPDFGTPELSFLNDPDQVSQMVMEHVSRWEDRVELFIEYEPDVWDTLVQNYVLNISTSGDIPRTSETPQSYTAVDVPPPPPPPVPPLVVLDFIDGGYEYDTTASSGVDGGAVPTDISYTPADAGGV
jgi:phage baseplate assembly protein W